MAKQAASEERLGILHKKLTETLIEAVQDKVVEEEVEVNGKVKVFTKTVPASASALAVAAKFLKDNSIFANPEVNGDLDELKSKLTARGRLPSAQDMKDALHDIGKGLLN